MSSLFKGNTFRQISCPNLTTDTKTIETSIIPKLWFEHLMKTNDFNIAGISFQSCIDNKRHVVNSEINTSESNFKFKHVTYTIEIAAIPNLIFQLVIKANVGSTTQNTFQLNNVKTNVRYCNKTHRSFSTPEFGFKFNNANMQRKPAKFHCRNSGSDIH